MALTSVHPLSSKTCTNCHTYKERQTMWRLSLEKSGLLCRAHNKANVSDTGLGVVTVSALDGTTTFMQRIIINMFARKPVGRLHASLNLYTMYY